MSTTPEHDPPFRESGVLAAEIEELRPALMAYVMSLLADRDACDDVVQETCLFLWNRREEFEPGTNFKAWAFKAAWFKVLTHRREAQRRKVVSFSEEALERISKAAEQFADDVDHRLAALRDCVSGLSSDNQRLLRLKYLDRISLTDHAKSRGLKPNQIQKSLSRIRIALRHCVETRLASSYE
ncbi:sigma-70 family RNA polymerase sigma factor [Luteolibacter yonseiensis]|uniref:Sigma-70 family RNA polymerase sigma factor n=1 Tax=Luteolibacter yonseiensis TaxID=1144680 RepID=A0A934VDU1_9BACT|nr:sigma-70 family RNA polymerase sigma factor [Luteolibacter yonseiensis]MBK1818480.1 sigma-70 family RNA polymerase sigma factor [Luteolibacter yonseiensis]